MIEKNLQPKCRKVKLFFKGNNRYRQQAMANSNSQMHRKELEEKASRIKEISITEKKGTEVKKRVKNWVWQKV